MVTARFSEVLLFRKFIVPKVIDLRNREQSPYRIMCDRMNLYRSFSKASFTQRIFCTIFFKKSPKLTKTVLGASRRTPCAPSFFKSWIRPWVCERDLKNLEVVPLYTNLWQRGQPLAMTMVVSNWSMPFLPITLGSIMHWSPILVPMISGFGNWNTDMKFRENLIGK